MSEVLSKEELKKKKKEENYKKLVNGIFQGPIAPVAFNLAIPVLIGNILMLLFNIVDSIFVSGIDKSSTAYMTGIGLVFPIYTILTAIATALFTGTSSLLANGIGANDKKIMKHAADSSVRIAITVSLIVLVLGYISGAKFVGFLAGSNISGEAIHNGVIYFYFLLPGCCLQIVIQALFGILQGQGMPKYMGICMFVSTIANIILDPLLIYVLKLGVRGAALGTTISIFLSACYAVNVIKKESKIKVDWKLKNVDPEITKSIIKIGIPQLLVSFLLSIGNMFLNNIVGSLSENEMNAYVLVGRIDQLLVMIGSSFGNSAITLMGQNFGRKNIDRMKKSYKTVFGLGIIVCLGLYIIYRLIAPLLFRVFTDRADVIDNCVQQVSFLSITTIGTVASIISVSAFQASGKAIYGFYMTFLRICICIIPLAYLFVKVFDWGIKGIYASVGGVNIAMVFISFIFVSLHLRNIEKKA